MSVNFGFSLPALRQYGAAGSNPFGQLGPTLDLSFVGGATGVTDLSNPTGYTLNTNFITPEYQVAAQYAVWNTTTGLTQQNFADIVTFTRASTATYFNSAGTLTSAAVDEARFDYNPSTLAAQGLLIEESRTNSIRNNTMQGAAAGTPGTVPTNWAVTPGAGLSSQIVGTGTENGITYIDIRIFGTTAGAVNTDITFELVGSTSALTGQTWTESLYYKLVGGTLTNISSFNCRFNEYTSGSVFITGQTSAALTNPTSSGLATQRISASATLNGGATTAQLLGFLRVTTGTGAVDYTLRVGLPQLELGAFATSVIPTTTTALTRSADVASVNTLSPWYNSVEGTLYAEYLIPYPLTTASAPRLAPFVGPGGSGVDEINFVINQPSGKAVSGNVNTSGVIAGRIDSSQAFQANTITKGSYAFAVNDRAVTSGGAIPTTSTAIFTFPPITSFQLGQNGAGGSVINGYLRRITYYPRRLANADLQTITT